MTFECELKDIRTNAAVWEMTGSEESEMRCTVLNREDYEHAYKLDKFYRTEDFTFEGIRKTVRRYIAEHELPIENPSTLECIIEVNV